MPRKSIQRETRSYPLVGVEIRETDSGPLIVGHAAVFDKPSENLGGFVEFVRRGAFAKTLQEADVRALFNHDPNYVLGRTGPKTLTLAEDGEGLAIQVTPPDTQWARDLILSMRRGDINQMSFGFRTVKDRWLQNESGLVTRELLEVQLFDVSVVTFPAYPDTSVAARSALMAGFDFDEPPPAGHLDGSEPPQRLNVLRRRLELAEKSL